MATRGVTAVLSIGTLLFAGAKYFSKPKQKSESKVDVWKDQGFDDAFPGLVKEFVEHTKSEYGMPPAALSRLELLLNYNCVGGKMYRGRLLVSAAQDLSQVRNLDFAKIYPQAVVLGWCIEVLQACFLVADDIMDGSQTRRGQPCWYKRPDIQMDAVNDSLILETVIYFLLKKYFSQHPKYLQLVELFHEVSYQTQLGQLLDLTAQPQGQKNSQILKSFNLEMYRRIVHYKTSFYTFYLSLAGAMVLCGYDTPHQLAIARDLAIELGEKFQIQDDYLDCYGDPNMIGKVGTDIQDHKCSWLVVQALSRVNPQQMQILESCYGKSDAESVAKVKQLYNDLDLVSVYRTQEESSLKRIQGKIQQASQDVPPVLFEGILKKIHGREK